MRMRLTSAPLCLLFVLAIAQGGEVPEAPAGVSAGMERGKWLSEAWGNPGTVERIDSKGKKLLKLAFAGGEKEKTAFQHATGLALAKQGKISLQAYSENPFGLSVAVLAGPSYTWHESSVIALKPGWNKIEFSVSAPEWKTEASGWKNSTSVVPLGDVRAVDIVINNKDKAGEVFIFGLQYDADEQSKEIVKLAADLRSDDADIRAAAEKDLIAAGKPAIEALSQLAEEEDSQEVQLRAALIVQSITKAAAAAQQPRVEGRLEGVMPVEANAEAEAGPEKTLRRAAVKLQEFAARPGASAEAVKKAQAELDSIRADLQKINERSAALIKSMEAPVGEKAP